MNSHRFGVIDPMLVGTWSRVEQLSGNRQGGPNDATRMYWPLVAIALTVPPSGASQAQARAIIRNLGSQRVSKESWAESRSRTERVVREADGRLVLLRTIDFE